MALCTPSRLFSILTVLAFTFLSAVAAVAGGKGLTVAHPFREGTTLGDWAGEVAQCIEQSSGIYVELVGEGRLGRSPEIARAVREGIIDVGIAPAIAFAEPWPELARIAQPGVVDSEEAIMRLSRDRELTWRYDKLGGWERNLSLAGIAWKHSVLIGSVLHPGELQGRKIRADNQNTAELLMLAGAAPLNLPVSEVHSALQVGVMDGAVVDAEYAIPLMERGLVNEMGWSTDVMPFVNAFAVVVSNTSLSVFGGESIEKIRAGCVDVIATLNERSFGDVENLIESANRNGVEAHMLDSDGIRSWRRLLDQFRAERGFFEDPVLREFVDLLGY